MSNIADPAHREGQRLAAVERYAILDTPPDCAFDRITALAARRFNVPISLISIVGCNRIWFKSRYGLDVAEIDRIPGLCSTAILSDGPYIINDAIADRRSDANPLVTGPFGLRFYAGVPLRVRDGSNLGMLSVIDHKPRTVDDAEIGDLVDMASLVVDQLELRLAVSAALGQSQLLAREADHRVMNSLQFIAGLLAMQSRQPGAKQAIVHLEAAANRIAAVAQVHRNFTEGSVSESDQVSCVDFLRRLCESLSGILGRPIEFHFDEDSGEPGSVANTCIQPIGLIVNELVTNAAKHGAGRIAVGYANAPGNRHELTVSDEGAGLPPDFDVSQCEGLGMKVVTTLAGQLGGDVTAGRKPAGHGAFYTVAFAA